MLSQLQSDKCACSKVNGILLSQSSAGRRNSAASANKLPPAAPTPVTFEEESYEAAMTDGDRFAAKTSYHAWNEEDPVEAANARRRREAAEGRRAARRRHGAAGVRSCVEIKH